MRWLRFRRWVATWTPWGITCVACFSVGIQQARINKLISIVSDRVDFIEESTNFDKWSQSRHEAVSELMADRFTNSDYEQHLRDYHSPTTP